MPPNPLKNDQSLVYKMGSTSIIDSSALLGADGTIYVPSGDGHIYALDQTGDRKSVV